MFKNLQRHAAAALLLAFAALAPAQGARAQGGGTQAATPPPATTLPQATPTPAPPAAATAAAPQSGDGHEWAPLLEQKLDYKDWTFKSLSDGSPVNLRGLLKGKKLVLVVYFAPWCGNWKAEAPVVRRLYDKYRSQGLEVVGVSEYASAEDSRKYFESQGGAPYPDVVESDSTSAREQTTHHGYRKAAGDARRWGSPFNVFLEPAKLNPSGDVLTERAWVVGGELIEKDVERFIRERLGITEQGAAATPCKDEPPAGAKKP